MICLCDIEMRVETSFREIPTISMAAMALFLMFLICEIVSRAFCLLSINSARMVLQLSEDSNVSSQISLMSGSFRATFPLIHLRGAQGLLQFDLLSQYSHTGP